MVGGCKAILLNKIEKSKAKTELLIKKAINRGYLQPTPPRLFDPMLYNSDIQLKIPAYKPRLLTNTVFVNCDSLNRPMIEWPSTIFTNDSGLSLGAAPRQTPTSEGVFIDLTAQTYAIDSVYKIHIQAIEDLKKELLLCRERCENQPIHTAGNKGLYIVFSLLAIVVLLYVLGRVLIPLK